MTRKEVRKLQSFMVFVRMAKKQGVLEYVSFSYKEHATRDNVSPRFRLWTLIDDIDSVLEKDWRSIGSYSNLFCLIDIRGGRFRVSYSSKWKTINPIETYLKTK